MRRVPLIQDLTHGLKRKGKLLSGRILQVAMDKWIRYLEYYKDRLQVPDGYAPDLNKEMKLLYSFDFLYESEMFHPAEYTVITAGNVHSFNTKNELQSIIKNMDSIRGGN